MRTKFSMILGFAAVTIASSQEFESPKIRGLRLYGISTASLPVAGLRTKPVTLEFDVLSEHPPDIELRFVHCDRDWTVTGTSFVNDDIRNRSRVSPSAVAAPTGVLGYTFHYSMKIPGYPLFDSFSYSGNYWYEMWDRESDELLARGKLFVTEDRLIPVMKVRNRHEPSEVNPYYQVHEVSVAFTVPPPDSAGTNVFDEQNFRTVDIYRNREIYRPRRVSADDDDQHTFVRGFATAEQEYILDNMEPGNEYRVLDLRSNDYYPQGKLLRSGGGADVSRFLTAVGRDNDGGSLIVSGTPYADYLEFRFELLWKTPGEEVYLVGDFNNWKPGPASLMRYEKDRYVADVLLRRGTYDYQYVLGSDWIILEGNSWGTTNNYTAFLYYRDPRFGGFDRLVGVARSKSPGGSPP